MNLIFNNIKIIKLDRKNHSIFKMCFHIDNRIVLFDINYYRNERNEKVNFDFWITENENYIYQYMSDERDIFDMFGSMDILDDQNKIGIKKLMEILPRTENINNSLFFIYILCFSFKYMLGFEIPKDFWKSLKYDIFRSLQ
jgi:hypothetical protein